MSELQICIISGVKMLTGHDKTDDRMYTDQCYENSLSVQVPGL